MGLCPKCIGKAVSTPEMFEKPSGKNIEERVCDRCGCKY